MSNAELQAMLAEKAKELFDVCDVEQKSFITKRDMQRLSGVLPLDPDQIESVFDRLDDDGNGYLTLEEFTGGFGAFMGVPPAGDDGGGAGGGASAGPEEAEGEYIEEVRPPPPVELCEIEIQTDDSLLTPAIDGGKDTDAAATERPSPEGAGDEDSASCVANASGADDPAALVGNRAPERIFKVVFVGDSGVGKSSIIHRFCQNSFKSTFSATIGIDFQIKAMCIEDQVIALQLWDTAGQERFRSITKQYFRKADGIVIVYDVTNSLSYLHLREWMESVVEGAEDGAVKMVLANKIDLIGDSAEQNVVDTKSGSQLADEFEALFYEVSAKSGSSINESFHAFASVLREKEDREMRNAIRISADIEKKKGCCGK